MKHSKLIGRRNELGISQSKMAEKIGIETCTYAAKELGKRKFTIDEIIKILNILNCSFEDIFLSNSLPK